MKLIIHTDGGARGNPGPAAIGVVIEEETGDKRHEVAAFGKRIGESTNNVAEYAAVIEALQYIKTRQETGDRRQGETTESILFYLDSTLVVNQLNGLFKVKESRLRELLTRVRVLEQEAGGAITYSVIPREQNRRADFFVNKALDESR